ncbi:hydroxybutyrate-dimer hydrolase [Lysobacter niastensis]|uniref:Hydroxybutyrate-dimer hydrolase n=1 Tax=Lysobacter niastensis TaxID=380629 RepID=A0ABU1W9R3_9GAMM|nr:3-hydroxybutyrate oligomer hydrolase family protein [Lysobacter niastensis]MDR7134296.1 hydroxybutyrate-dimer hydrolase [Lysobacter niastensis]
MIHHPFRIAASTAVLALAACASHTAKESTVMFKDVRVTEHRGNDDLLTAGLGIAGLRAMTPPALADAEHPTPTELRRRALWSNWRGIADLAPGGGYGELYGSTAAVPGREFGAMATVPGAGQPHRVLAQVPDAFDTGKRCVVVTASSGSRGIYGAIAVAGAWGLPKGCAVAYTDKGAGTDYFDLDAGQGVTADGTVAAADAATLAFAPDVAVGEAGVRGVAFKHAHSRDNPEADWGRHVKQAAQFALQSLDAAFPQAAPFTFDNTRVIAVGISNGGGAVLRAAELDGDWLDAVVAAEPNIYVESEGGRALYDYTTQAALLMPCALLHMQGLPQPPLSAQVAPLWAQRCVVLKEAGLIEGSDAATQAKSAHDLMKASGWSDEALRAGALSVGFDLWRAVAVPYASAYGRYMFGESPCGNRYAALDTNLSPRVATNAERAAWWSDASGIPPGAGVNIVEEHPTSPLQTLRCLRDLWQGGSADAQRVRKGIAETRAGLPRSGLPIVVIHGADDGLIPMAFSSAPYVKQAKAGGRDVRYWQVRNAQHFDAFLGLPDYGARYLPLLPYVYEALDRVDAHLDGSGALPVDAVISTTPRGAGALQAGNLAMPGR